MKILDYTAWDSMLNEVKKRNEYTKQYYDTKYSERKDLPRLESVEPRCDRYELNELDLAIATMSKPTRGENGKVSPSLTLATIEDQRLKDYLAYVALETSRSKLMKQSAKDDPRHTILVPIFLAAHKQYNGIGYEEWDKSDKYIRFCVGNKLYDSIAKWREIPLSEEMHTICRRNALVTKTGKPVAPTAYPRGNIKLDSKEILNPSEPFRHIWLQTWVANVELRNEYMILDVNNWDSMPKALDAVFQPKVEVEEKQEYLFEEDMPW